MSLTTNDPDIHTALSCDCEIYEICRKCAPSPEVFEKACRDRDEALERVKQRQEADDED